MWHGFAGICLSLAVVVAGPLQGWGVVRWDQCTVSKVMLLSLPPSQHMHRERSKKKKKKQEKQMKGKMEKKGAASKSSSSTKSSAKNMSESFKSKEFVSSDESSSAESKKEVVGLFGGGLHSFTSSLQACTPLDSMHIQSCSGGLSLVFAIGTGVGGDELLCFYCPDFLFLPTGLRR